MLIGRHGDDWLLGGAGDDVLDGNAGEDALEAQDGADKLYGGGEDDALVGGPGPDYIYGEYPRGCEGLQSCVGGADMIDARDGTRDVVDCGDGTDGALLDQLDELVAPNCETTGRPDAPAQPQGKATSACRRFKVGQKRVCTRLAKALSFCHDKRCVKKVARRARRTCRSTYRPPFRGTCLRVVRKIVRAL